MGSRGRFERLCESLPPVEFKMEHLDPEVRDADCSRGRFERLCDSQPPVAMHLGRQSPALVITLQLQPDADPVELAGDLTNLMLSLTEFDRARGGKGLMRDPSREHSSQGLISLALVPTDAIDTPIAATRLDEIAALISGTTPRYRTALRLTAVVEPCAA